MENAIGCFYKVMSYYPKGTVVQRDKSGSRSEPIIMDVTKTTVGIYSVALI